MIERRRLIRCKDLGSEIGHKGRSVQNHSPDSPSSAQLPILVVFLTRLILFLHLGCLLASTSLPRSLLALQYTVAQLSSLVEWSVGSCGLRLIADIQNSLDHSKRFVSVVGTVSEKTAPWNTLQRRHVSGPESRMR